MIPDHIIKKAAAAIYAVSVFGDEFAIDAWHDMPDDSQVKTTTRMFARAALEAVAADILSEGWRRGAHDFDIDGVYTFEQRDRLNPYTKETA